MYNNGFGIHYWNRFKDILGEIQVLYTNVVHNSTFHRVLCFTGRDYRPVVII